MTVLVDDPIHGKITSHNHIVDSIIETDLFKRLKHIKQLGALSYIYANATHTRYAHCIGTYHCALKMMSHLEENSGIEFNNFYRDCISIAGLLHDIGHGPFSHLWEGVSKISHEENSEGCIDKIFQNIKLFKQVELHNRGIQLIKALIRGDINLLPIDMQNEIKKNKSQFIFKIISNSKTGIDVDKWDYLRRDKYYLDAYIDFKFNDDFDEVFTKAKVVNDEIVYHSRNSINNLFETRSKFFIHFYRYPLNLLIEKLIIECAKISDKKNLTKIKFDKNFNEISSNDNIFLHLMDYNVINFFETSKDLDILELIYYVKNTKNIQLVSENRCILEDKEYRIEIKIEHAGENIEKIKNNLKIGDEFNGKIQEVQNGYYEAVQYFKLIPINNNNNKYGNNN